MHIKKLLTLAAIAEALTGLGLLAYPPIFIRLLFDSEIASAGVLMSRLAGITLIALGIACWPDRNIYRAFLGMLTYSLLAALFLVYAGASAGAGMLLWPAFAAHAGLSFFLARQGRSLR